MASTNAERQRRFKKHSRGDHSECLNPQACTVPTDLGSRGRQMWIDLTAEMRLSSLQVALLYEACRLADKLDRFAKILAGDSSTWLQFKLDEDSGEYVVQIDRVVSEARQHAVAFKQVVAELRQSGAVLAAERNTGATPPAPDTGGTPSDADVVDLSAYLASVRAPAEGPDSPAV